MEHLLGYRWSGHGAVPWPFDGEPELLAFGPVGRTPSTLLYLTFDGPLEREIAGQSPPGDSIPPIRARQPPTPEDDSAELCRSPAESRWSCAATPHPVRRP
jgi:hypothetical protein